MISGFNPGFQKMSIILGCYTEFTHTYNTHQILTTVILLVHIIQLLKKVFFVFNGFCYAIP